MIKQETPEDFVIEFNRKHHKLIMSYKFLHGLIGHDNNFMYELTICTSDRSTIITRRSSVSIDIAALTENILNNICFSPEEREEIKPSWWSLSLSLIWSQPEQKKQSQDQEQEMFF